MYSTKEIILGIHYKLKIYVLKNKRTERTKENFQKKIYFVISIIPAELKTLD